MLSSGLGRWRFILVVGAALPQEAAAFGIGDHAQAFSGAFGQANARWDDCTALDKAHVQSGKDPLVAACDARPMFTQFLLALRHLLAVVAGHVEAGAVLDSFLVHAGELDAELGQLTTLGKAQPLFFWHGPKRHVPSKFEELLSFQIDGRQVSQMVQSALGQDGSSASTPPMALPKLGLEYPTAARSVDVLAHAAVRVSGPGDVCALGAAAAKAGIRQIIISGLATESIMPSCLDANLQVVWDLSEAFNDLFDGESKNPLGDAVQQAMKLLKRPSLDAIGLPQKAWFDKRLKGYVQAVVKALLDSGTLKAVALAGAVSSKQLGKILGSSLRPSSWLVPHDDCAPISSATLKVADEKKIKVIGFGSPRGAVMEYVAKQEKLDAVSLLGRWTAELGMAVALPQSISDLSATVKQIQEASPLSTESWRLLSSTASLSRPASLAVAPDFEDSFGLRPVLERAARLATGDVESARVPPLAGSLSENVWKNLESDRAQFDDNHFIIYKENFLSPEQYSQVKSEAARLWSSKDLEPNCNLDGRDRTGGYVLDTAMGNSSLYNFFYGDEEFRRWVSRINGHQMFPSDFPMELREYPTGSSGMNCHRDLLMYANGTLDLEFAYTIDNFGTCISTYTNRRGETTEVHTQPNSLIMVRPNSAMHCVKPSEGGHRTILKFIYVGDYRKSSEFGMYTTNYCSKDNPNVLEVLARRERHRGVEL